MKPVTIALIASALTILMVTGSGCFAGTTSAKGGEQQPLAVSSGDKVVLTSIAGVNSYEVRVEIENGVAVIQGQVYDRSQVTRATEEVSKIDGVNRVINRLRSVNIRD